ncbi:unnamed protein product [Arctogadus glacialis]
MSPVNQKDPQSGDLIEIFHAVYKHWAVYVGDGFVVHLIPNGSSGTSSSSSGSSSGSMSITKAMVKYEELKAVVGDDKWEIHNLMDDVHRPQDAKIIVTKARQLVGTQRQYHVLSHNCEHFATEMRYGISRSRQPVFTLVRSAYVLVIALGAVTGLGGLALAGLGMGLGFEVGVKASKSKTKTP